MQWSGTYHANPCLLHWFTVWLTIEQCASCCVSNDVINCKFMCVLLVCLDRVGGTSICEWTRCPYIGCSVVLTAVTPWVGSEGALSHSRLQQAPHHLAWCSRLSEFRHLLLWMWRTCRDIGCCATSWSKPKWYIHVYTYIYIYIYIYTYTYHIYIYICIHTCVYVYIYMYTHLYMHIYIYIYALSAWQTVVACHTSPCLPGPRGPGNPMN